jgi:hypothetical protein
MYAMSPVILPARAPRPAPTRSSSRDRVADFIRNAESVDKQLDHLGAAFECIEHIGPLNA